MSDQRLQALECALVAVQDGLLIAGPEVLVRAQQAGHEKVEDTPKLRKSVLDGCARERKAMEGIETLDRTCRDRRMVLDVLGLVERHRVQIERLVTLDIAPEQVVRGHENVRKIRPLGVVDGTGRKRCLALLLTSRDGDDAHARREALELGNPVVDDRCGTRR